MTTSTPTENNSQDVGEVPHHESSLPSANILVVGEPAQSWDYFYTHTENATNGLGIAIAGCDKAFYTEKLTDASFDLPFRKIGFSTETQNNTDSAAHTAIPELGTQLFEALDATPRCDILYITNITPLLEHESVQSIYRLLYLVSKRVTAIQNTALYAISADVDQKTRRILQQPMDYCVTFDATDSPSIQPLGSAPGNMNDSR
ncbi:hypothetical protein [Haladaptatus sp. DJG-WS-42]|uniref:DUF7504 family protein n=1 Tax=Haladaptatus sp. DJG-WS-42 TaxID=3120516 RepID=UPI0030CC3A14